MGASAAKRDDMAGKIARRLGGVRDRAALLEAPPPANEATLKHVAISGVSYCGSTLLARILGSLPGVSNIGESHWLLSRRESGVTVSADLEQEDWAAQVHCWKCGRQCEFLTREFRLELAADPSHWYHRIAQRLDTDILISADKNHNKIVAKDPLLRLDALVLFKSPRGAVYSHFRHLGRKGHPEASGAEVAGYLDKWARSYELLLDQFDVQGKKVFLGWEEFCAEPVRRLEAVCAALGLPFDAGVLERIDPEQHSLGGNGKVNQHFRRDAKVEIRPLQELSLPEEQEIAVGRHSASCGIFERLGRGQSESLT